MKKLSLSLLAVVALCFVSCDCKKQPTETVIEEISIDSVNTETTPIETEGVIIETDSTENPQI